MAEIQELFKAEAQTEEEKTREDALVESKMRQAGSVYGTSATKSDVRNSSFAILDYKTKYLEFISVHYFVISVGFLATY